jgi:eukaryotic-like serine/threonine-protein kinase
MYQEKDLINGQYEVCQRLAGGMGYVYIAVDQVTERTLAVKTLKDELLDVPEAKQRFEREAKTWVNLGMHEHIVHAIAFQRGEIPLLLLEYIDGVSLHRLLRNEPAGLAAAQAIRFALQMADGLAYAHCCPMPRGARGVIHRDLKPGNVMISRSCVAKLTDFGLALAQTDSELTSSRATLGTLPYMPPEQWENAHTVTPRADVYALGAVIYETLTGVRAFKAQTFAELMYQVHNVVPSPITDFRDDVDPALIDLVMRCLRKSPEDRPASAAAVTDQLETIRGNIPLDAPTCPACRHCGYVSNKSHLQCPVCDTELVASPVPPAPTDWMCRCGRSLAADYRYCIHCGRSREAGLCTVCQGTNPLSFRFCCHCGSALVPG